MTRTNTPIKVFVADDHPMITLGVSNIIKNQPNKELIGKANSIHQLFDGLEKLRPNVLLLDLNMPGGDFYKTIKKIQDTYPWIKIIAYTAYHSPDLLKSLVNLGVKGFLLKTCSMEEMHEAIEQVYAGEVYIGNIAQPAGMAPSDSGEGPELADDFRKRLGLSKREQEILVLISRGMTSQGIGKHLFISKHTVETHRKNILRKLDFNSSTELVKFAVQHGLV